MPKIIIKKKGFMCNKCGHKWLMRKYDNPRICPECKSVKWDD